MTQEIPAILLQDGRDFFFREDIYTKDGRSGEDVTGRT